MAIEHIFDSASSVMTVISFSTFMGIVLWTFVFKKTADFEQAAMLPFADEENEEGRNIFNQEKKHV
jgi:cytochrome c oxidase cbb3-type subunit 4